MRFVLTIGIFDMIWPVHIENLHKVDILWPKKCKLERKYRKPLLGGYVNEFKSRKKISPFGKKSVMYEEYTVLSEELKPLKKL